jgi:uncharacterized protein (DUF427 family)
MPRSGSAHPILLEPAKRRWRAYFDAHVIADTNDALILHEASLAPVVYFPRADVAMEYMGRTRSHTRCPHKGDAAYFTLAMDGRILEDVAWSYEEPLQSVERICERIAFDASRIEIYDVDDALVNPRHFGETRAAAEPEAIAGAELEDVDETVLHTDSGSGVSQREHWAPNVTTPRPEEGGLR